jgi:intracellular multiplication protein IcmD
MSSRYKSLSVIGSSAVMLSLLLWSDFALADGVSDLSGMAAQMTKQIISLSGLLVIISYISGIGFAIAGIVQFKAHKDNPQQTPLSKPLVYLGVGAALLFLPTILSSAGTTLFGSDQSSQGAGHGKTNLE